jgi:hypothetical protein
MLFSDEVLFLHVPKAGGSSITRYLLNELRGPLTLCVPENAFEHARGTVEYEDVNERLTLIVGKRHETLPEAIEVLESQGRHLADFVLVLAVARNPYELERSHFLHLQNPYMQRRRRPDDPAVLLARAGDFERFCKEALFMGGVDVGDYFLLDGREPPNMRVVRFERLEEEVPRLVSPFGIGRMNIPHVNRTPRESRPSLTPRVKRLIEVRHPYLAHMYGEGAGTEV